MIKTSFLSRTTLGQPNYLIVAMACAFVLALVPTGARRALDSNSFDVEQWLPADYAEVQDLSWFRDHFRSEQFALVTWDGCTLGDAEQLELLAKKLRPGAATLAAAGENSSLTRRAQWFNRIITGPQVVRHLMDANIGLSYGNAAQRLEGVLVGPPQRDAQGRTLGDETRTTCMIVHFSPAVLRDPHALRAAVDEISQVAAAECGVDPETMHVGGPPVDNATVNAEAQRTLFRLAAAAGILGVGLCFWRLGSVRLTALVVGAGAIGAGVSLAVVYYFGAFEVFALGHPAPQWGALDAALMAMPAVIGLLASSAALHIVNYYLEARRDHSAEGAAERAMRLAWRPIASTALATAAALASLTASDVVPVQKFGLFSALALVASIGVLLAVAPVLLHRFPLSDASLWRRIARRETSRLAVPAQRTFQFIVNRRGAVLAAWSIALVALAAGVWRVDASVQILNLLDDDADLIRDYAWIEEHIGNVVPMEVVLTMPAERLRGGDEHAEQDGQQYRLTMLERLELLRQIERRLEQFPEISRALSAATFTPQSTHTGLGGVDRGGDYFKNNVLQSQRHRLMAGDFLRMEREPGSDQETGRELWRLSARVSSRGSGDADPDYAVFLDQLRRAVDPVLLAYQQRDRIVRALHEQGKQLKGARLCVLFRAPGGAKEPPADVQERALADLLCRSGVAPRGVSYYNLATFQAPGLGSPAQDEQYRERALASLREQDAVVLASAPSDPVARKIAAGGIRLVRVANLPHTAESIAAPLADDGGPRPIRAVFTGMLPVVERAQRQLLGTLRNGLLLAAGLAAIAMMLALMSIPAAGLALVSSLFPLVAVFGAMGWLGVKTDLGIMITAGVALGVAIEGTLHLATWFRRSLDLGLPRRAAAFRACQRCGPAIIDGALIGSLATLVLGLSAFVPVREFGLLMIVMLGAALVGNLLLLPAVLATPCGWFFASAAYRRQNPVWPAVAAWLASRRATPQTVPAPVPAPAAPLQAPHFGDQPAPARRTLLHVSSDERREMVEGPHSALHAKLQSLRRPRTGDSAAS